MIEYSASQGPGVSITLMVGYETYLAAGPTSLWRVTTEGNLIQCMKCREIVDLGPKDKDLVLWCRCAECSVVNIEDTLDDLDDPEDS